MTPREFFNAWIGWAESRNEDIEATRAIQYGAARWQATQSAWSKEQSKAISKYRFPWEKQKKESQTPEQINNIIAGMG